MSEDLLTLLPSLPIGYFWRVGNKEGFTPAVSSITAVLNRRAHSGYGISLRHKTWYGSTVVLRSVVVKDRAVLVREAVALEQMFEHNSQSREDDSWKDKDKGDYHKCDSDD